MNKMLDSAEVLIALSADENGISLQVLPRDESPDQNSPAVILAAFISHNLGNLMQTLKYIPLQSGRIAHAREIKWWDKVVSYDSNFELLILKLACRVVTIDRKPLTLAMAEEMALAEAAPIIAAVTAALVSAYGVDAPAAPPAADGVTVH